MTVTVTVLCLQVFVPLTIGGGIRDLVEPDGTKKSALEVAGEYFRSGADKVNGRNLDGIPARPQPPAALPVVRLPRPPSSASPPSVEFLVLNCLAKREGDSDGMVTFRGWLGPVASSRASWRRRHWQRPLPRLASC